MDIEREWQSYEEQYLRRQYAQTVRGFQERRKQEGPSAVSPINELNELEKELDAIARRLDGIRIVDRRRFGGSR